MKKTKKEEDIGITNEELEEISWLGTLRKMIILKEVVVNNRNSSNRSNSIMEEKVENRNMKKENLEFSMKEKWITTRITITIIILISQL